MGKCSEEYYQGFKSKSIQNPYTPGTEEFNEFERGWVQRQKRGLPIDETQFGREQTSGLTYAMNKNKPTSAAISKKASLDELIRSYGLPKYK